MQEKVESAELSNFQVEGLEILELIGQGGMSLVYKARQLQLDRIVALKLFNNLSFANDAQIQRFRNEANLSGKLDHPNIVKCLGTGVSSAGVPYLLFEFLEGRSLAQELAANGRLSLQQFKDIFIPVLSALEHAHSHGLVHRDIKPGNIMLCRDAENELSVKLVDFGIAQFCESTAQQNLTATGALIGSPAYMSPEQCMGKVVDSKSDLYSLCCVMYEAIVGAPPFVSESALELMNLHIRQSPPTVAELDKRIELKVELAPIILSGLEKEPEKRPASASTLNEKIVLALDNTTLSTVPRLKTVLPESPARRLLLAGSILILALAVAAVSLMMSKSQLKEIESTENIIINIDTQIHRASKLNAEKKYDEAIRIQEAVIPRLLGNRQKLVLLYSAYYQLAESYLGRDNAAGKIMDPSTRNAEKYSLAAAEIAIQLKDRARFQNACELRNSAYTHVKNDPQKTQDVIKYADQFLGKGRWETLDIRQDACVKLLAIQEFALAEKIAEESVDLATKVFTANSFMSLRQKGTLALVWSRQGKKEQATRLAMTTGRTLIEGGDPGILSHRRAAVFVDQLFPALGNAGKPELVQQLCKENLAACPDDAHDIPEFTSKADFCTAQGYWQAGEYRKGTELFAKVFENVKHRTTNLRVLTLENLINAYTYFKEKDKVEKYQYYFRELGRTGKIVD